MFAKILLRGLAACCCWWAMQAVADPLGDAVRRNEAADAQGAAVVAGWFDNRHEVAADAKACPGCCSSHGGITSRCASSGRVYCADGSVSPSCSCSSCGVATPPPPPPTCTGGRVWNGAACVCTLGRDFNGSACVCSGGRDFNGSACVCSGGRDFIGTTCMCSGGRSWTGSQCVCPAGQVFQNGQCVASTPTCPAGQNWNGSRCVCPGGQGFDGTRCVAVVMPGNVSGVWYDTTQAGHGLILEQLTATSLFAVWYTFDPEGRQAWFLGNGGFDGTQATLQNVRPQGVFFDGNLGTLTQPAFGNLQVQFLSCSKARLEFDLPAGFGKGGLNLTRLTQPAGLACDATPPAGASSPNAGMTGVWYEPARPGRGVVVEVLPNGTLFASWFTHGAFPSGGQAWFVGNGANAASSVNLALARPTGTRFPPNFVPGNIVQTPAGQATLQFRSCASATLTYEGSLGRGSVSLARLTKPQGIVCVDPVGKSAPVVIEAATAVERSAHADTLFTGEVVVDVDVLHRWRGDLQIVLRDPAGREHPVFTGEASDAMDDVRLERRVPLYRAAVDGTWTLLLRDRRAGDTGELRDWNLRFESSGAP